MIKTLTDVANARKEACAKAEKEMVESIPDDELVNVITEAIKDPDEKPGYMWELKPLVMELIARYSKAAGK